MLRTYKINIRKNWCLQPSIWNNFFNRLKSDIEDLNTDMANQTFTVDEINTQLDSNVLYIGQRRSLQTPNL